MGFVCTQCLDRFPTKWGLKVHARACAKRAETLAGPLGNPVRDTGVILGGKETKRHLPRGFPLERDWDVGGSTEPQDAKAGRHLDNVLLRDEAAYWGKFEDVAQTYGTSSENMVMLQNDGRPGEGIPGQSSVDSPSDQPDGLVVGPSTLQTFSTAEARPEEIVAATCDMISRFGEKLGRNEVDLFLRLATSEKWAQLIEGKSAVGAPQLPTTVAQAERACRSWKDLSFPVNFAAGSDFEERYIFRDGALSSNPSRCPDSPSTEIKLKLFVRSPVETIRKLLQEASAKKRNFFFDPVELTNRDKERVVSHPMSGRLAHEAIPRVRKAISSDPNPSVIWSPESFVALLQFYSDKSSMSLKSSAFTFYPLHVSCLGFTSEAKDSAVRRGDTVVAYLPVDPSWTAADQHDQKFGIDGEPIRGKRNEPHTATNSLPPRRPSGARLPSPPETRDILAKALDEALRELREASVEGIWFRDADGVRRKAHFALASYVGDTPEVSTVACTKNNRCARCDVQVSEMGTPGVVGESRTSRNTEQALFISNFHETSRGDETLGRPDSMMDELFAREIAIGNRDDQHALLEMRRNFDAVVESGLTSIRPSLLDWPFSTVHESLDLYRILRCDMMHTLPLGILKTLVTLVTKRLRSTSLTAALFLDAKGRPRTYLSARKQILSACNHYLKRLSVESPAVDFHVDFSKGHPTGRLDGLFADQGIAAMLEAKDMKNVQQVLPFVGALLDRLCYSEAATGNLSRASTTKDSTPMTDVFTSFDDLQRHLVGKVEEEVGFTQSDVQKLHTRIEHFKTTAIRVFGEFQASSFCFPKFHSLEHIVQDIIDLGNPAHYSADAFEASHVRFKTANRTTSRRRATALAETTRILSEQEAARNMGSLGSTGQKYHRLALRDMRPWMLDYLLTGKTIPADACDKTRASSFRGATQRGSKKRSRAELISEMNPKQAAVATDSCCLSFSRGSGISFIEISQAIAAVSESEERPESVSRAGELVGAKLFIASLGGCALAQKALDIVSQHAVAGQGSAAQHTIRNHLRLHIVKSAYAAGFPTPTVEHQEGDTALLTSNGARKLQKIVAALSYSHSTVPRQESVMIETAGEDTGSPSDLGGDTCEDVYPVWFAKVLVFMHTRSRRGTQRAEEERAVVRYYEVISREEFDAADEALACIKLKWAMDPNGDPWIDVIPASSIRGRVHVVPGDEPKMRDGDSHSQPSRNLEEGAKNDEEQEVLDEAFFLDSHDWKSRRFYVNRFKVSPKDVWFAVQDVSSASVAGNSSSSEEEGPEQ